MNKLLIIILFLSLGCRSTKHTTNTHTDTVTTTDISQQASSGQTVKTDNNIVTVVTTQTVETNYFNPDSIKTTIVVSDGKGVIKSVKTTTTKINTVDKGKVETVKTDKVKTDIQVKAKDNTQVKIEDKKTAKTQWWAIFGIVVVVLVGNSIQEIIHF